MGARSLLLAVITLALAVPADAMVARPSADPIDAFLQACRVGDCAAFRAFVRQRYHAKVLAKPERVEEFVAAFVRLREDFGVFGEQRTTYDTTYRSTKHHLYSPALQQWVTVMFVMDDSTGKARGHGIWRREGPPGWVRPPDPRSLGARIQAHLQDLGRAGLFTGAVLLVRGDEPIVHAAVGTADGRRALTTRDRFPIASITKMFTAAVILSLEEEGRLSLDDPIAKHLPDYPRDIADQVTIRQLLQHTSGIELDDNAAFNAAREAACTLEQALAVQIAHIDSMNEGRRPGFRPLGRHDYSNENYDLLGVIAERVAREPFDRLLTKRVLVPAGLRSTSFAGEAELRGRTHSRDSCGSVEVVHASPRACPGPAGGLFSTTEDLMRFLTWLRAPRPGRGSRLDRMTGDSVPAGEGGAYGLGVEVLSGRHAVGHNGGFAGASGELRWLADDGLAFIALCNRERSAPDLLRFLQDELGR